MKKPTKKTKTAYDYLEVMAYIEKKYKVNVRDYYGRFSTTNAKTWNGPMEENHYGNLVPPYADFWHWFIHGTDASNGSYMYFPDDLYWDPCPYVVKDDPKCYDRNYKHIPKFVMEIMDLVIAEFGEEILTEPLWVAW